MCISNSKERSRQHQKRLKAGLVKHKRSCSSTSANPFSAESIKKISRRKEDSYTDSSFLEGPSMDRLIIKGKAMVKKDLQLPPGNLNAYLLRNSSFTMKTKTSKSLTPQQKERRNIVDHVNYQE
jgi:hypothetical protein